MMLFPEITQELLSLPFDFSALAYGTALAAAGTALGAVFSHEHNQCSAEQQEKRERLAELEKVSPRTLEQTDELASLYAELAGCGLEHGADFDEIIDLYGKAEAVLKEALALGDDTAISRKLGNVYLNRAVVFNDFDDLILAVENYKQAVEVLTPLDESGDGESTYDLAGVKLNLGVIYREDGDLEKAKEILDEAFLLYRKIEKIGVFDTRYYLAKVSVQQGGVLFEMDEPLDKIVDAYNRAMRLFVEVIEDENRPELERDLANVLLDRCTATYQALLAEEFESDTERTDKISNVLVDVGQSIDLLENQSRSGNEESREESRSDLFNALLMQANILLDLEKYEESLKILDRIISDFADYASAEHPLLANEYAAVLESRASCVTQLGKTDEALKDYDRSIQIREELIKEESGLDPEDREFFIPQLAVALSTRAMLKNESGDKSAAKAEVQHALDLLNKLSNQEESEELLTEIKSHIQEILAGLK